MQSIILTPTNEHARATFHHMTICFAISHACVSTPMVYASSVLRPDVAYLGSGTLFLFKIVSSLVVAVPLIDRVGLRSGLCVGMLFACVYVGGFTLAAGAVSRSLEMCLIPCYYFLGTRCGNGIPIFLGAASFASLAALLIWAHCCTHWGLRILIFYVLQGSGRAVFESTVKAVFCDSFKGDDADAAFANIFFVQALASALCFFMSASLGGQQLAIMVLVFALLTPVGYSAKIYLDTRNASESSPLIEEDKRVV